MKYLKKYNGLILEKRIAQISSNIEVFFSFDIVKTNHADVRSDFSKRGLDSDNQSHISNSEMSELVLSFRNQISEDIALERIVDGTEFVIRSREKELSMAIIANKVSITYWKLIIKTVFRESEEHSIKVGKDQLVYGD